MFGDGVVNGSLMECVKVGSEVGRRIGIEEEIAVIEIVVTENVGGVRERVKGEKVEFGEGELVGEGEKGGRGVTREGEGVFGRVQTLRSRQPLIDHHKRIGPQRHGFERFPSVEREEARHRDGGGDGEGMPSRHQLSYSLHHSLLPHLLHLHHPSLDILCHITILKHTIQPRSQTFSCRTLKYRHFLFSRIRKH